MPRKLQAPGLDDALEELFGPRLRRLAQDLRRRALLEDDPGVQVSNTPGCFDGWMLSWMKS